MAKLNITSAKLTGNPGEAGWAQVHEFAPDDAEKLKLRGRLVAVIATSRQTAAGRELLTRLHEEYFGNIEKTAFNALKDAVEKVIDEFSEDWGEVEISAVSIVDDIVYTACGGGAQAAVFRNGILAKILASKKGEVVSASGSPKNKDIFLLATKRVFTALSEGSVKAALQSADLNEATESLAPAVHTAPNTGNLGLVLIRFGKALPFTKPAEARIEKEQEKERPKRARTPGRFTALLKRKMGRRRIYVRRKGEDEFDVQKRKVTVSIGAILVVLLVVSIGFGIKQKITHDKRARYEDRLKQAQHEFEEANNLFKLNPERARELFKSARALVSQMEEEGVEDLELEQLSILLEENRGQILGEHIVEPDLFLDLSILTDGFEGDAMAASEGKLFVLDKNGERVVRIEIETKRTEVMAGPEDVDKAEAVAAYSDRVFVLEENNIYEVSEGREKVVDGDWSGKILIYAYAGNLYVLETEESEVWRYAGVEGGFGSSQRWLAPGVEPNLTNVFSWTIDGSVWFVSETGKVFKFTKGNQDELILSDINPGLTRPSAIYTNEELNFIYILEKETGRIIILGKNGDYKAQYFSDKIKEARGLAVSEEVGKIIFLTEEKLYSIDMGQLD